MNFFVNMEIFADKPAAALLLNADIVAGNAARQWLAADSGKPRILILVKRSPSVSVWAS